MINLTQPLKLWSNTGNWPKNIEYVYDVFPSYLFTYKHN